MRITENVVNDLRDELIKRNAAVRFMHVIIGIAESMANEPEVLTMCMDKNIQLNDEYTFKAVLNKFSTGHIDMRQFNRCYMADVEPEGEKVATAVWDAYDIVEDKDTVCSFFSIEGSKELCSITVPNPYTNNQDDYNWCMMVLLDLVVLGITGAVSNGKEA